MKAISCTGRYDGKVVQLDEEMDIPKNAAVIVTVLPKVGGEGAEWHQASLTGVGGAYAPNEPEYPLTALKEQNPDYVREGDIALAAIPQADGQKKVRPVLLRQMPGRGDYPVC